MALAKKVKEIPIGTIRIEAKTLKPFSKTKTGWRKIIRSFPELATVVSLYKASDCFDILIDSKNPRFLKGQISPEGREQGARIVMLPNGEKLEKAFSLFAPHIRLHDQDSHDHWDVLYQNKGGTWSYVYTLEKRDKHRRRKYAKVDEFAKCHEKLLDSVEDGLWNSKDEMALPLYTLLKTNMRVGNEIYYKAHGHKGLSTLQGGDVMIQGNIVRFCFLGKDGVPISLIQEFPQVYIKRLAKLLKGKKDQEFIFSCRGHLLHERDFKKAFKNHCGKEFYPHIVRSYFATSQIQEALALRKEWTKLEMNQLFLSIAHQLGHKKFDKKTGKWNDSFSVTVKSYVQPELLAEIKSKIR